MITINKMCRCQIQDNNNLLKSLGKCRLMSNKNNRVNKQIQYNQKQYMNRIIINQINPDFYIIVLMTNYSLRIIRGNQKD